MLQLFVHPCPRKVFFICCYLKANKKRCVLNNFVSPHKKLQGAIIRVCSQN